MLSAIEKIDTELFYLVNRAGQNLFFDVLMPFVSNLNNFIVPIIVFFIWLILKKSVKMRTIAVMLIVLVGMTEFVSSNILKNVFERPRPFHSLSHVRRYNATHDEYRLKGELKQEIVGQSRSLPSSHASNTFAVALFLSFYFRKFWPLCYGMACLVGYSRVYLGVHFPFDVVSGAILGSLLGVFFIFLSNKSIRHFEKKEELRQNP